MDCIRIRLGWVGLLAARTSVIVGILLLLCTPGSGHTEEPEGDDLCGEKCSCRATVVRCFEMIHIPKAFPRNTTKIYFEQLVTELIPADAFKSIPMVKTIEFSRSNIGRIAGCAFDGLPYLEDLYIIRTVIGSIATMAVSNIAPSASVVMRLVTITTLETAAFSHLTNLTIFQIGNSTVHEMEPNAFSGIENVDKGFIITRTRLLDFNGPFLHDMQSVGKIAFTENTMGAFPCLALDSLVSPVNQLTISDNYINCTCIKIGTGDHLTEHDYVKKQLMNSMCVGLDGGEKLTISERLAKNKCKPTKCESFQSREISRLSCKPERIRRKNTNPNNNGENTGSTSQITLHTISLLLVTSFMFILL